MLDKIKSIKNNLRIGDKLEELRIKEMSAQIAGFFKKIYGVDAGEEDGTYTEEEPGETEAYSEDYYDQESYDESYDEGMIPEATNDGTME